MFGIHSLPLFIVSCIMLNLTPGQDTMYINGRSLAQGRKAGVLSVMGIITGVLVHTMLAGFVLSARLASSAIAFPVFAAGDDLFHYREHLVSGADLQSDLGDRQVAMS